MTKSELRCAILGLIISYNRRMYQYGKDTRTYGTSQLLRIDQIQLINLIGDHPGINLRSLAELSQTNVPTLSLQVNRLVKLNLIEKKRASNSQREIVITLTADGQTAYQYHKELDEDYFTVVDKGLDRYTQEQLLVIYDFLHRMNDNDLRI